MCAKSSRARAVARADLAGNHLTRIQAHPQPQLDTVRAPDIARACGLNIDEWCSNRTGPAGSHRRFTSGWPSVSNVLSMRARWVGRRMPARGTVIGSGWRGFVAVSRSIFGRSGCRRGLLIGRRRRSGCGALWCIRIVGWSFVMTLGYGWPKIAVALSLLSVRTCPKLDT
jgi:hypothetical protein